MRLIRQCVRRCFYQLAGASESFSMPNGTQRAGPILFGPRLPIAWYALLSECMRAFGKPGEVADSTGLRVLIP